MSCMYAQYREMPLNRSILRLPDRKTRLAALITFFILSLAFLALIRMPFPEYRRVREVELDADIFDLIEPPPQPLPERDIETRRAAEVRRLDEMMKAFHFEEMEMNVADMIQEMDVPDPGGLEGMMATLEDPLTGDLPVGGESFLTGDDINVNLGLDDLKSSGDLPQVARAGGSGLPASGSGGGRG
ncbi:MAG TPA: hypothetical protein ENN03_02640, partial [bacterium]|nr:hypothetical protein [bacterium]